MLRSRELLKEDVNIGQYLSIKSIALDGEPGEEIISQIRDDDIFFDDIREEEKKEIKKEVEEVEKTDAASYKVGDFVNHKIYGDGIIVSLEEKDGNIQGKICFVGEGSIKTFDMSHPSIRKRNK